ncbi:MAG: NAD(P)-dependent oxidoreductase, partial [Chloroflexales bacterium]|nr:NAD(P)-dependent oxidoreductase [Chloroflexales bacterium]
MRVLITGGTGFIGRRLGAALLRRGYTVQLMGRTFAPVSDLLASGAVAVPADLRDANAVAAACAGVDAVCHAGAYSAPWGRRADLFAVNVEGTAHVIAGCRRHAVRRLVAISSPAVVFAGRDLVAATEDAPYPRRFSSTYALTKKLAEDVVRAAPDVPAVILRPKAGPSGHGQMSLFSETGRTLTLDVRRYGGNAATGSASVLASGPKELRLEPQDQEQ